MTVFLTTGSFMIEIEILIIKIAVFHQDISSLSENNNSLDIQNYMILHN